MAKKQEIIKRLLRDLPTDPYLTAKSPQELEALKEDLRKKPWSITNFFRDHITKEGYALVMEIAPESREYYEIIVELQDSRKSTNC